MSTFSYFFSEAITDFTMGIEPNRDEQEVDSQQHSDDETEQYVDRFFLPIPLIAEIILLSLTILLGFVLNAIIFRCYFGVTSKKAIVRAKGLKASASGKTEFVHAPQATKMASKRYVPLAV